MPVVINEFETSGESVGAADVPSVQAKSPLSRQRAIEKELRKLAKRQLRFRRN